MKTNLKVLVIPACGKRPGFNEKLPASQLNTIEQL